MRIRFANCTRTADATRRVMQTVWRNFTSTEENIQKTWLFRLNIQLVGILLPDVESMVFFSFFFLKATCWTSSGMDCFWRMSIKAIASGVENCPRVWVKNFDGVVNFFQVESIFWFGVMRYDFWRIPISTDLFVF